MDLYEDYKIKKNTLRNETIARQIKNTIYEYTLLNIIMTVNQ